MFKRILALCVLAASLAFAQGPVYELRTYTAPEGKLEALIARFRDRTIPIFNRLHMESVGYWVPTDGPQAKNTLIYILKHPSRAEADKNWRAFLADEEWKKVVAETEKDGPLATKVDRVYMDATTFSKLK